MKRKNNFKINVFIMVLAILFMTIVPSVKAYEEAEVAVFKLIVVNDASFENPIQSMPVLITDVNNPYVYYTEVTDKEGKIIIASLPIGTYDITINYNADIIENIGETIRIEHKVEGSNLIVRYIDKASLGNDILFMDSVLGNIEGTVEFDVLDENNNSVYHGFSNKHGGANIPANTMKKDENYYLVINNIFSDIPLDFMDDYYFPLQGLNPGDSLQIVVSKGYVKGKLKVCLFEEREGVLPRGAYTVILKSKSDEYFCIQKRTDMDLEYECVFDELPVDEYTLSIVQDMEYYEEVEDFDVKIENHDTIYIHMYLKNLEIGTDSHGIGKIMFEDSQRNSYSLPNTYIHISDENDEIILEIMTDEQGNTYIPLDLFQIGKKYKIEIVTPTEFESFITPENKPYEFTFTEYTDLICKVQRKCLKGDINRDGKINSSDAALALELYTESPNSTQLALGDMDGNGKINSTDATIILEFFAEGTILEIVI